MPTFTVERDKDYPSLCRVYEDGIAIGTAGTYDECDAYVDLIKQGEG